MALTGADTCADCDGTGRGRPGRPRLCETCRGTGVTVTCALCGGSGFRRLQSPGPGAAADTAVPCGRCRQRGKLPAPPPDPRIIRPVA